LISLRQTNAYVPPLFSFANRVDLIHKLTDQTFDLLVVGGGITGAGIALDAATRGLRVALLEKNDFASGTSSRSTKLIHGGLRYLKQLEFGLVKEVGSERAIVHQLATHLVVPEKMLLPLYEKRGLGYWLTSIGLKLYDWLAAVKGIDQRKMLTRNQTLRCEPLLHPVDVKGGAIYAEYRTDDARLTIEIIKTAYQKGALPVSYCTVTNINYQNGIANGVNAIDGLSNATMVIKAKVVVNAAGPWVDELRELDHSKNGKYLHLTKGVHIVVGKDRFPIKQAIYFDVEDGRMIFAIPRGRTTYIGTTDTNYTATKEEVAATSDDARYLINAVNKTFPTAALLLSDIESSWAGLRPLIHEEGKSASELSRKDEIFESASGLISIAGGKLTGYRKMAERVVDLVLKTHFPVNKIRCQTNTIPFTGGSFKDYDEVKEYTSFVEGQLKQYALPGWAGYLVGTYGRQSDAILAYLKNNLEPDVATALLKAELWFCFNNEMILTPADFIVRRTAMLYFDMPRVKLVTERVLQEFKFYFQWSDQELAKEKNQLNALILSCTNFKK
jgi:glycerol-3-phosphate dehydrogenase